MCGIKHALALLSSTVQCNTNAPINVLPHPPPAANVGNRWGFANIQGCCLTPGADYKGETPPNPVLLYMEIRRDLLHSSYSHDSQVRLAGEILSLGGTFFW